VDESVKYYIQQARRNGFKDHEIKESLLGSGWNEEFVDLLLGQMPGGAEATEDQRLETLKTWVKAYYKSYSTQIAILCGLTTVSVFLGLFLPWSIKFLVDSVFDSIRAPGVLGQYTGTITLLYIVSFMLLVVYVLQQAVRLWVQHLNTKYSYNLDRAIKAQFFGHILRLPLNYRSKLISDDYLFKQSAESSDLTRLIMDAPVALFGAAMSVVGAFIIMFTINIQLAITSLLIVPALYGAMKLFAEPLQRGRVDERSKEKTIFKHTAESIQNIEIVQAFSKENVQTQHLLDLLYERVHSVMHHMYVRSAYDFVRGLIVIVAVFIVLFVGGRQILRGTMSVGELLIFLFYINSFFGPMKIMSRGVKDVRGSIDNLQRFYDLLTDRPDVDTRERRGIELPGFRNAIFFNNAQISHDDTVILNDVTLRVDIGKKIGIVGPTGSGKSTLLRSLQMFTEYTAGSITIDGVELHEINTKNLREQFTLLDQDPQLFSDTILKNILYGVNREKVDVTSDDVVAAITAAGALEFVEGLPKNYETNLGEALEFLTPGQLLRLSIARAYLRQSPILLIDEPTNALDVAYEKEVLPAIFELMKGKTVVMASNKLSLLTQMDEVYVLDGGTFMNIENYGGLDRYMSYLSTHELI
jgi:ATP-binding cassette subfamily B protein